MRLSPSAQHLPRCQHSKGWSRSTLAAKLVPAIAERWIITDDGLSYIFRLREGGWPDGDEITASDLPTSAARKHQAVARHIAGGLDLGKVEEIRAMTGRVIEIRLSGPMPDFLRLLAQPELGFVKSGGGSGPIGSFARRRCGAGTAFRAAARDAWLLPVREDWEALARPLEVAGSFGSKRRSPAFSARR